MQQEDQQNHQSQQNPRRRRQLLSFILFYFSFLVHSSCEDWPANIHPLKSIGSPDSLFELNTNSGHLKLIGEYDRILWVGGRNKIHRISLTSLNEVEGLEWKVSPENASECQTKGMSDEYCQNYIRVAVRVSCECGKSERFFVCGTNGFKPTCRNYNVTSALGFNYQLGEEVPGEGHCPYSPLTRVVSTFAKGQLYSGLLAQRSANDALIYRDPLRTYQHHEVQLFRPHFVNSFHYKDHVYFFFKETSLKSKHEQVSRVARVCTNDTGGPSVHASHWTSFFKARLTCQLSQFSSNQIHSSFSFDEIQSSTGPVRGIYNGYDEDIVYAVFTTPRLSQGSSAICAFLMRDIIITFERSNFKGADIKSVPLEKVPQPQPGTCVSDTKSLSDSWCKFVKDHPFMDSPVLPFTGSAIFIHSSQSLSKSRLTAIAVDPHMQTIASGLFYDVIFVGTDDGQVLKLIYVESTVKNESEVFYENFTPLLLEKMSIFEASKVTGLHVHRTYYSSTLVVVANDRIKALSLSRCSSHANSCSACVALRDPYCTWDTINRTCSSSNVRFSRPEFFVQNIEKGHDDLCGSQ